MNQQIRPVASGDYEALVAAGNAATPYFNGTVESMQKSDESQQPERISRRLIAAVNGTAVGSIRYTELSRAHRPGRFTLYGWVHPDHQRQGIGAALFGAAMAELQELGATSLRSWTEANLPHAVRFLEQRGYVESERHYLSYLDLAQFDFTPYDGVIERVEASGIRLISLAEWKSYPNWERRYYDLHRELLGDVPEPDLIPSEFEAFVDDEFGSSYLIPEAYLIALDGDTPIGTTSLHKTDKEGELFTHLTGVRRAYRHRGIALALKLKALRWAAAQGYSRVGTSNAGVNRPMLAINERMGFVKRPANLFFTREVGRG